MNDLIEWVTKNVFQPGRLATVLVLVFLFIFMGVLPSPMLSAIGQVTREHQGLAVLFTQICVNTARTEEAVDRCFRALEQTRP